MPGPTLLWFRQDLRLADNPAARAAAERGAPVIPVFIWDPAAEADWAPGAASRWWLHHSLAALRETLRARGSDLIVRRGETAAELERLRQETGADAVYWNRRYEPAVVQRDRRLKGDLSAAGLDAQSFNSALLFEPHTIRNREGNPFRVFSPYWRTCLAQPIPPVVASAKARGLPPAAWPGSVDISDLELRPRIPWDKGLAQTWQAGESAAAVRLKRFLADIERYADERDDLDDTASSLLSAALHFGEIGPRQIWAAVKKLSEAQGVFPPNAGAQKFLQELGWREFAHHLLFHFPESTDRPLRREFERFGWRTDPGGKLERAWRTGRTGYPIVDAAMRQLWATGWMPNRARMIVASFWVKHLRRPWQEGARWFWDTLVDADLANNTLGWQWVAGTGADAAPYFRIFAPVLQGRKFDPEGRYIRRWVPELSGLGTEALHAPWEAPPEILSRAGVRLGADYPRPVVDHREARVEALAAFEALRSR